MAFALKSAASRWRQDKFLIWDAATETFTDSFYARMFRMDRFKSIYTRPVHRRQITLAENVSVPSSKIVKWAATGDVYILSDIRRSDQIDGEIYDSIVTLHLASDVSGGYAEVHRYAVAGTGEDLGPLVETVPFKMWTDMELRTTSADPDLHDEFIGHYFMTCPAHMDLQKGDYVHLHNKQYRVDETYFDSGYLLARVADYEFDKEVLTFHVPQGSGGGYDATTGTVTPTTMLDRQVSASVERFYRSEIEDSLVEGTMHEVFIDYDHIGFTPKVDYEVTYNGTRYKVTTVETSSDKKQFRLVLRSFRG